MVRTDFLVGVIAGSVLVLAAPAAAQLFGVATIGFDGCSEVPDCTATGDCDVGNTCSRAADGFRYCIDAPVDVFYCSLDDGCGASLNSIAVSDAREYVEVCVRDGFPDCGGGVSTGADLRACITNVRGVALSAALSGRGDCDRDGCPNELDPSPCEDDGQPCRMKPDGGTEDAGTDAGLMDAGFMDAGLTDGGTARPSPEGGAPPVPDASWVDSAAGLDAGGPSPPDPGHSFQGGGGCDCSSIRGGQFGMVCWFTGLAWFWNRRRRVKER